MKDWTASTCSKKRPGLCAASCASSPTRTPHGSPRPIAFPWRRCWRLSHSEGHCYRMRVDRFLNEEMPEFEPDDAQMYLDLYREADAEDSFDHFEEQRDTNMEFLRTLPRAAGERRAMHKEAGEITLQQMLHEWAMHDLGHIRQIAELVRARMHWRQAGTLGESYKLRP